MKRRTNHLTTVILIVVLIVGLSLLLYPSANVYTETAANPGKEQQEEMWPAARNLNFAL